MMNDGGGMERRGRIFSLNFFFLKNLFISAPLPDRWNSGELAVILLLLPKYRNWLFSLKENLLN